MSRQRTARVRDRGPRIVELAGRERCLRALEHEVPDRSQPLARLAAVPTGSIYGVVKDEYGVPVDTQTYYTGGEEEPNRPEKLKLDLPPRIKVQPIGEKDTLAAMLRDGGIDAFYTARMPSTYHTGGGKVKRLFENYMEVEQAYYRKTGIFPIMHVIAMRRDVYEANRWVATTLLNAFEEAKQRSLRRLSDITASHAPLPWLGDYISRARELFRGDPWPYGIELNRVTLEAFLQYAFEQGVCHRRLAPEELFPPEVQSSFRV